MLERPHLLWNVYNTNGPPMLVFIGIYKVCVTVTFIYLNYGCAVQYVHYLIMHTEMKNF